MKNRKPISLKNKTLIGILSLVIVTFILTASIVTFKYTDRVKKDIATTVALMADEKEQELEYCFSTVERFVKTAATFILHTINEERILSDPNYEEDYMEEIADILTDLPQDLKGITAVYFRMEHERFGGTRGIFMAGNPKNGFIGVKNTDLKEFLPNDTEHVGWYYIPIWKKKPVWTTPYENKNINTFMISYVIPLYRNGKLLGVVGMDLNLAVLKEIVSSFPIEQTASILIGTERNLIHAQNMETIKDSIDKSENVKEILEIFKKGKSDFPKKMHWGKGFFYGTDRQISNGMTLIVALPQSAFVIEKTQILLLLIAIFIVIATITWIIGNYSIEQLIKPISIIASSTSRLARGEINTNLTYKSDNELGQIADNIRKMSTQTREYIDYIREQTQKERRAKESAQAESQSKSQFLAMMYLSLHEIDLNKDIFTEIHSRADIAQNIGTSFKNARATVRRVMEERVQNQGQARKDFMDFIDFSTLEERMAGKITIAHEFYSIMGYWCRARFILMDRNPNGTLHHILWAVENIDSEKKERERLHGEIAKSIAASQAKSAFLANMSHEIRTPINAVLGMNEMILREAEDKAILGYAANIRTAGKSLLSIVNDILDFSKIEAGKMELLPENYDISSVIVDLVNMISDRASKKNLEFILNADSSLPKTLHGDSVRIKQCILNLLTNAVKYTKEGSVKFSVGYRKIEIDKIELCISVKDTGSGIKQEDMEKLLSPFERIEEGKNKTIEGTGLGMSIVTKMLAMMNSKLNVQSEYGKGSEFSFEVEQEVVDWTEIGDIKKAYTESSGSIAEYKEKLVAPKAKILFVDDTEMNLEVIKGLLKKTQIQIDTALSGKETLEKVQQKSYDILFIDHRMPEMDGIQTLHALENLSGNLSAGKPCIALTANAITGVKQMYIDEGFTDYLSKPVNPDRLEDMIKKYLPKEYIEEVEENTDETTESNENPFFKNFSKIEGINAETALVNCGTEEILEMTVRKYLDSISEKAQELDVLQSKKEISLYGTKVHALKSTSRLIGAMEVSQMAAHLEEAADRNDFAEIEQKHAPLMTLFRSFAEKLKPLFPQKEENAQKNEISHEEIEEKLSKIAKMAEDFDIDGLDSVLKELSESKLPDDFLAKFDKIKKCIENVDFDGLKSVLENN